MPRVTDLCEIEGVSVGCGGHVVLGQIHHALIDVDRVESTWREKLVVDLLDAIEDVLLRRVHAQLNAGFVEAKILARVFLVEKLPEVIATDGILEEFVDRETPPFDASSGDVLRATGLFQFPKIRRIHNP